MPYPSPEVERHLSGLAGRYRRPARLPHQREGSCTTETPRYATKAVPRCAETHPTRGACRPPRNLRPPTSVSGLPSAVHRTVDEITCFGDCTEPCAPSSPPP